MNSEFERRQIERLRIAYSAYYDAQDLDGLVSLFTEEAVCHFPEAFGGDWVGRQVIRARFGDIINAAGAPYDALHIVSNPWIELTSDTTATGRWYLRLYLTRQHSGSPFSTPGGHNEPLMLIGLYEDHYQKGAGQWRIARTRMSQLWPDRELEI